MKTSTAYLPFGIASLQSGDPDTNVHLLWCYNDVGHEAIGVAYVPANMPMEELKPGLVRGVVSGQDRLFPCEGVLNEEPLQCTGPFRVVVGSETLRLFAVNWRGKQGMRAFLVFEARDREHAIAPFRNWYLAGKKRKITGTHLMVSDTIRLIVELEDLMGDTLSPQKDFTFKWVKV